VQVNFNSLAQCSNTCGLAHACCPAQPGHWPRPVTGPGRLGPAPKNKKYIYIKIKNKKNKKIEIEIEIACIRNKKINVFY